VVTFSEGFLSILFAHLSWKLIKVTSVEVYHVFICWIVRMLSHLYLWWSNIASTQAWWLLSQLVFTIIIFLRWFPRRTWLIDERCFTWLTFYVSLKFFLVIIKLLVEETLILILIKISLRWFVASRLYMKLLKLFTGVFLLFPLFLFLSLFQYLLLLFADLGILFLSECFEYILIVKKSVRELVFEIFIIEELGNSALDNWHL